MLRMASDGLSDGLPQGSGHGHMAKNRTWGSGGGSGLCGKIVSLDLNVKNMVPDHGNVNTSSRDAAAESRAEICWGRSQEGD